MDDTGSVTLLQSRGNRPSRARRLSNYTDQILALSTGVLSLKATATVTDFDSDTATDSGTLDMGDNLKFADDGPQIDIELSGAELTTDDRALAEVRDCRMPAAIPTRAR